MARGPSTAGIVIAAATEAAAATAAPRLGGACADLHLEADWPGRPSETGGKSTCREMRTRPAGGRIIVRAGAGGARASSRTSSGGTMTNYAAQMARTAKKYLSWGAQGRKREQQGYDGSGMNRTRDRGNFPRIIVATDLDDTLVDSREPSRDALKTFNYCWKRYSQPPQDVNRGPWAGWSPPGSCRSGREEPQVTPRTPLLVYVTGRSAESFRKLVVRCSSLDRPTGASRPFRA